MKTDSHIRRWIRGFSMTEMVTVISIIGVLAKIAITSFSGLTEQAKTTMATERMEMLNTALNRYAMAERELVAQALQLGSEFDEQLIVMTLQMDDERIPGSPFIPTNYIPQGSSDTKDHRLQWRGKQFKLLEPGQPGTGLKVPFDGSDMGAARQFPPNFQPYGR